MKKHDMVFNEFYHFCNTCPFKKEISKDFVLEKNKESFFTYMIITCEYFLLCGYVKYMIEKEGEKQ